MTQNDPVCVRDAERVKGLLERAGVTDAMLAVNRVCREKRKKGEPYSWDTLLDGVETLTFDFEQLKYISSAGLRVLLSAQKIMNEKGSMKVVHVNENIMEIFEATGFSEILTIE